MHALGSVSGVAYLITIDELLQYYQINLNNFVFTVSASECEDGWLRYQSSCYMFSTARLTFESAQVKHKVLWYSMLLSLMKLCSKIICLHNNVLSSSLFLETRQDRIKMSITNSVFKFWNDCENNGSHLYITSKKIEAVVFLCWLCYLRVFPLI